MLGRILIASIRGYQLAISSWTPPSCRFTPTCSAYAIDAVRVHGALRGSWLALRRLARCHPWGGFGWDPVPPPRAERTDAPVPAAAEPLTDASHREAAGESPAR